MDAAKRIHTAIVGAGAAVIAILWNAPARTARLIGAEVIFLFISIRAGISVIAGAEAGSRARRNRRPLAHSAG